MSGARAERTAVFVLRQLAVGFAVVGILFVATPDGVIHTIDGLGDDIGSFAHGPATREKLWLALAFAYMTVITGIAVVASLDVVRYRPFLLVLAAGKAASSLAAGAYFHFVADKPGPTLEVETDVNVAECAPGKQREVALQLHNRSGRPMRVLGLVEC